MLVVLFATILINSGHASGNIPLIEARQWPYSQYAKLEGYIYDKVPRTYEESVEYCGKFAGVLPSPTHEKTWDRSLKIMKDQPKAQIGGYWIGVQYERNSKGEIVAKDAENVALKDSERKKIFPDESVITQDLSTKLCVAFMPSRGQDSNWSFTLQACKKIGTTPRARTLCAWSSEKYKEQKTQEDLPKPQSRTGTKSNVTVPKIDPRSGVGGGENQVIVNDGTSEKRSDTASNSSTPLAIVIAGVVVCCLVGSLYYVSKKRGWDVRQMISQRMPYNNRPRVSINGELYSRGQELSEITSHSRPIHVYEEIIPRNSGMLAAQQSHAQRDNNLSCSSTVTIPRQPPPEPPTTSTSAKFRDNSKSEDGYMKPNFCRGDFIPGDVRSPLPNMTNVFTFPQTKDESPSFLKPPVEKELKYASVETIHTFLGDEKPNDEEYLVEDQSEEQNCKPLVVDIPEKSESSSKITGLNPYVHVNGHSAELDSVFSPVFPYQPSEYENERFLRTVMKKETRQKPPRKNKMKGGSGQSTSQNGSIVYASIPAASNEPIYTQIKKKEKMNDVTVADVNASAYTPMKGEKELSASSCMIPISNQDMNNSAAKYYEIPPEGNENI